MTPQCSNCFFSRPATTAQGDVLECRCHNPSPAVKEDWPIVEATDWCGEGWDAVNGNYGPPRTAGVTNP